MGDNPSQRPTFPARAAVSLNRMSTPPRTSGGAIMPSRLNCAPAAALTVSVNGQRRVVASVVRSPALNCASKGSDNSAPRALPSNRPPPGSITSSALRRNSTGRPPSTLP